MKEEKKKILIGSDHSGQAMKRNIKDYIVAELGLRVRDIGYNGKKKSDYAKYALKLAELISTGQYSSGILVGLEAAGMAIAANRYRDVRACVCYDHLSAINARKLYDCNALVLSLVYGTQVMSKEGALRTVKSWLHNEFELSRLRQNNITKFNELGEKGVIRSKSQLRDPGKRRDILIGSDHAGFELKNKLKDNILALGYDVSDVGIWEKENCDYSDYAIILVELMATGRYNGGILVCGTGQGMAMAANSISASLKCGVRTALCNGIYPAIMSRKHNNSNVLAMGADIVDYKTAVKIVTRWINTPFDGGRHKKRIEIFENYKKRMALK